jgi:hypothetical protein
MMIRTLRGTDVREFRYKRWICRSAGALFFSIGLCVAVPVIFEARPVSVEDFFCLLALSCAFGVPMLVYCRTRYVVTARYVERIGLLRTRIYFEEVGRLDWYRGECPDRQTLKGSSSITFGTDIECQDELLDLIERSVKRAKRAASKRGRPSAADSD